MSAAAYKIDALVGCLSPTQQTDNSGGGGEVGVGGGNRLDTYRINRAGGGGFWKGGGGGEFKYLENIQGQTSQKTTAWIALYENLAKVRWGLWGTIQVNYMGGGRICKNIWNLLYQALLWASPPLWVGNMVAHCTLVVW